MSFEDRNNPDQFGGTAAALGKWRLNSTVEVDTGDGTGPVPEPLLIGDKLCIPDHAAFCLRSIEDGSYLWCVPFQYAHVPWFRTADRHIYITLEERVHVIDEKSGEVLARLDCAIRSYSERMIFSQIGERGLAGFSIVDGRPLWSFEAQGYVNYVLSDRGCVAVDSGLRHQGDRKVLYALRETDGAVMGQHDARELREQLGIPLAPTWTGIGEMHMQWKVYCFIDDYFLVSYYDGILLKLRIPDFAIEWVSVLSFRQKAEAIIEHDGRLYINFDQGFADQNKLICLDWKTGEELWRMDEPFTPRGIKNPIMIGKYYIGGAFHYLSVYDVEKREFTWRHKDKVSRFGGGLWASGPWLVSRDLVPSNKLHVFKAVDVATAGKRRGQ